MCTACNPPVSTDPDAFADRFMEWLNGSSIMLMISVGHRTGLFDTMSDGSWNTSEQLAVEAGLNERYVREWLGAMTTARVVEHDPDAETYRLPEAHARWLTRAASPNNLAATSQWIAVLGYVEDPIVDVFEHGRGVPYASYRRFHEVMAEESGQTVVAALDDHILPLVEGLTDRLATGIDVLDVGCGRGRALMKLAEQYPASRFTGVDFSTQAIEAARAEVVERGLVNIGFEVRDAAELEAENAFDLILTFDAVHDQAQPNAMLAAIRRAIRPNGLYLCQEIKAESDHAGNIDHPLGPFLYTISCMHCMSVSLAQGGPGLGAVWGRRVARQMIADAGFRSVEMRELEHDPLNDYYLCRP